MEIELHFPEYDHDQVTAAAHARHEAAKAMCSTGDRFIGSSLGAWLGHARAAELEHVPARLVAEVPRDTFLRVEEPEPGDAELWASLQQTLAALPRDHMARWDHCSSLDLKGALAEGRMPNAAESTALAPWDPRAYDLAHGYPGDVIAVWARPWIRARWVDSYPLEFRVFVQNSCIIGVASYYPQRPLPATPAIMSFAAEAQVRAERLVAHMDAFGARPWMPNFGPQFDGTKVSATLDFVVTAGDDLLFLEAGPPFGAGAHPCAFIDRPISGVALALAPGVILR